MKRCLSFGSCVCLWTLSLAPVAYAEEDESNPTADGPEQSWIDTRHEVVSSSADHLATWVDGFFSTSRSVENSPVSLIRIRPQYEWDEDEGSDWKLRVTGRLFLPAASERLSLVFLGENDDLNDEFYDPALSSDGKSSVGIQYQVRENTHSRIDLTAGLKAGPKGKLGGKYLFQAPFWSSNRFRFSEELFWIGGDGFGTMTRVDIDHILSSDTLLRWANRAEYSEESNGVEWVSRGEWIKRLQDEMAIRTFVFIKGETDPRFLQSRGVGVSLRRQFLRRWLFWEVEPGYQWRKARAGESRDGVFGVELRLELVLGGRDLKL